MRIYFFRLALAAFMVFVAPSLRADTPLDLLGLEKSINDAARRAQETGDYIAKAFADQALRIIAEWRKANGDLINIAFDRLDEQTEALFNELDATAQRIQQGRSVAFIDIQRTLATAGSLIARLPFATSEPSVIFYWPAIVTPSGGQKIDVRIVGPELANSNPIIFDGDNVIQLKKLSDTEIGFDVERSSLKGRHREIETTTFLLRYEVESC